MKVREKKTKSSVLSINVAEDIDVRDLIKLRGKHQGRKKPTSEIVAGYDLHRKGGEWRTLDRVIDWENDQYSEVIVGPNGEIVRKCLEPLSKHTNRGSAKKKLLRS